MIELFEEIKRDKNDKEVYRDKETNMPLFQTEKSPFNRRVTAEWHPDMLELHPDLNKGLLRTTLQRDGRDGLEYSMLHHYETMANLNFKHPHVIKDFTEQKDDGKISGVDIHHEKTGEKIGRVIHASYGMNRVELDKEFAQKNGIHEDVRSAHERKMNMNDDPSTRIGFLDKYLETVGKKPVAIGVRRERNGALVYKPGDGVEQHVAAKRIMQAHKKVNAEKELDYQDLGNGNYMAHHNGETHMVVSKPNGEIHQFIMDGGKQQSYSTPHNITYF